MTKFKPLISSLVAVPLMSTVQPLFAVSNVGCYADDQDFNIFWYESDVRIAKYETTLRCKVKDTGKLLASLVVTTKAKDCSDALRCSETVSISDAGLAISQEVQNGNIQLNNTELADTTWSCEAQVLDLDKGYSTQSGISSVSYDSVAPCNVTCPGWTREELEKLGSGFNGNGSRTSETNYATSYPEGSTCSSVNYTMDLEQGVLEEDMLLTRSAKAYEAVSTNGSRYFVEYWDTSNLDDPSPRSKEVSEAEYLVCRNELIAHQTGGDPVNEIFLFFNCPNPPNPN